MESIRKLSHCCFSPGLSIALASVLKRVPLAVLFGVFLFMGVSSLNGVQFADRVFMLAMPRKHHLDVKYVGSVSCQLTMIMMTLITTTATTTTIIIIITTTTTAITLITLTLILKDNRTNMPPFVHALWVANSNFVKSPYGNSSFCLKVVDREVSGPERFSSPRKVEEIFWMYLMSVANLFLFCI